MMKQLLVAVMAVALWTGCDHPSGVLDQYPQGTLENSTDLDSWSSASAPQVYFSAVLPMGLLELGAADGGCPVKTTSGNVDTYTGGCEDQGTTWVGTMVVDNGEPDGGSGSIEYKDFGLQASQDCNGTTLLVSSTFKGSLKQTATSGGASSFEIDLRTDSQSYDETTCASVTRSAAWDYKGTHDEASDLWNGSGRLGDSERGVVTAETVNEQLGDTPCSGEAQSGTTTIHAGANTAVITYDGASKCDSPAAVGWTLNGTAMGEVQGISCAAVAGTGGLPSVALLIGALLWVRRRRS